MGDVILAVFVVLIGVGVTMVVAGMVWAIMTWDPMEDIDDD